MADTVEATEATAAAPEGAAERGRRQVKVGRVVSNKMEKTVVVAVATTATHRLYHRTTESDQEVPRPRRGEPVQRRRRGGDRLQPSAVEDEALAGPRDRQAGRVRG